MWNSKKGIKIEEILNLHTLGFSPLEISEKLNCHISNISKRLISKGIKPLRSEKNRSRKNRYLVNESFFDKIDTQEKAYILGLAYADGSVSTSAFYIKMKDEDLLLRIKKELNAEQPVKYFEYRGYNAYILTINSQKICKSLIKQGCFINKTYTLKFPSEKQVPKELLSHFIRGFFDGDGSVNINIKHSQSRVDFTSASTDFLRELQKLLSFLTNRKGSLLKETGISNAWHLRYSGESADIILKWMYKNSTIFMKRKHDKILIYENVHLKQGELLETPTLERQKEDNQQPSLGSNSFEGSTTNSQVQILDSNADTSALQQITEIKSQGLTIYPNGIVSGGLKSVDDIV